MSDLHEPKSKGAELVGPFEDPPYRVVVNGYRVPHLAAGLDPATGEVTLFLDGRFGMDPVSQDEYRRWVPFVAHCMAVAAGYSCHGENSVYRPNPYKVGVIGITFDEAGEIAPAEEPPPLGLDP